MLMGLLVVVQFRLVGSKINAFTSIFAFWLQPVKPVTPRNLINIPA